MDTLHVQKNCIEHKADEKAKQGGSETVRGKKTANKVGLITRHVHVLGVREFAHHWIVDSGATYNSKEVFEDLHPLSMPQKVTLGDGHTLEAIGIGAVED